MLAIFRDPGIQWILFACCVVYFLTCHLLKQQVSQIRTWRWEDPDLWLMGSMGLVTVQYALDYATASRDSQALTLIAGMVIGKGVGVWATWVPKRRRDGIDVHPAPMVSTIGTSVLVVLLSASTLCNVDIGTTFQYRGLARWQGPWSNPNQYGLLMGVGLFLAMGGLFQNRFRQKRTRPLKRGCLYVRFSSEVCPSVQRIESLRGLRDLIVASGRILWRLFLIIAVGLCGLGLLMSYSRGAWVGVALGLMYWLYCWRNQAAVSRARQLDQYAIPVSWRNCIPWSLRNRIPLLVILASLGLLAFWELRHTEQPLVRRAFSLGNPNDFSWRNRVAAWEGASAIMAANLVAGVGWSRAEATYQNFYRPAKVSEGTAIQLNHYLVVGMSAGLPALICLLVYLGISLVPTGQFSSRSPPFAPISNQIAISRMVCHSGAVVLLVGAWFDGALFNLATAAPMWMLLELGNVRDPESTDSAIQVLSASEKAGQNSVQRVSMIVIGVVAFTLLTGLVWAHARDPFRRVDFAIRPSGAATTKALVVVPKTREPLPVVIWVDGSGGDLMRSGESLQQIAEHGLAAVGFEFDQTSQADFDAQMSWLLEYLPTQSWARDESVGWIANSLGAQRTLSFALRNPDHWPQVMVRLNGGWIDEAADENHPSPNVAQQKVEPNDLAIEKNELRSSSTQVWLVHGEQDRVFPVSDVQRLADALRELGWEVKASVIPGRSHGFGSDQPLLVSAAAQYCANAFGAGSTVQMNERPSLIWIWIPLILAVAGALLVVVRREIAVSKPNKAVVVVAAALGALALGSSALHLLLPMSLLTERSAALIERRVVRPELRQPFRWLVDKALKEQAAVTANGNSLRSVENQRMTEIGENRKRPFEKGEPVQDLVILHDPAPKLRTYLQHVELASLQREIIEWEVDDEIWLEFVMSPWIGSAKDDLKWRRVLWESFYPRMRRESSPSAAVEIVARHLALRVRVGDAAHRRQSLRDMWIQGLTDRAGFERLYVAALRSVGVPARLGTADERASFHDGVSWLAAPRPLSEHFQD